MILERTGFRLRIRIPTYEPTGGGSFVTKFRRISFPWPIADDIQRKKILAMISLSIEFEILEVQTFSETKKNGRIQRMPGWKY